MAPETAGPLELKELRASAIVVDPTPMALGSSAGEFADEQDGPELPLLKSGTMPAVCQALMTCL